MMEIHIRLARHMEIPLLQQLQLDAGALFRSVGMDDVADNPPKDAAELDEAIGRNLLWVACDPNGAPMGMAQVIDHGGVAHLEEISVRVAAGRKGVGTALLRVVMHALRERGYGRITLSTFAHLAWNRPFYEKLGFAVISEGAWEAVFHEIRRKEIEAGLDVSTRVFMGVDL